MPYNGNIPQPNDAISQSQDEILQNFQALQTLFQVNHVNFNQRDQGKHKWLTLPVQVADPATGANEIALYSKTSTLTLVPELFMRRQTNGAVIPVTSKLANVNGWAYTSSGLLLKWGLGNALAADFPFGTVQLYPVAATVPVFNFVYAAFVTEDGAGDIAVTLDAFDLVGLTVVGSQRTANVGANANYRYLVIGTSA